MSEQLPGHITTALKALTDKLDDFITEVRKERIQQNREVAELFRRVGNNEGDIKALQQTRPTTTQLLAAMATAVTVAVGIIGLLMKL